MASFTVGIYYASTVLLAAYCFKAGLGTPPPSTETPLPDEERAKNMDIDFGLLDVLRKTYKLTEYLIFTVAFCEAGASAVASFPGLLSHKTVTRLARDLCPRDSAFDSQSRFPIWAWVGCIAVILGSTLRVWSIRSLGRFFTYEVSIRPGHRLYTGGPYGFVRHPAYAGLLSIFAGQLIFAFSGGTFTNECLKWAFPIGFHVIRGMILCQATIVSFGTCIRVAREDRLMKTHFGDEWATWAAKTRYLLLPGVF